MIRQGTGQAGGQSWNTGIGSSSASIAERNSFSRLANNFSSRIRGSRTSRNAASLANPREASCSMGKVIGVWKPARSAHSAVKKQRYLSSRLRGAPSIAGNASSSVEPRVLRLDLIAAFHLFISPGRGLVLVCGVRRGKRWAQGGGVCLQPG